MYVQYYVVIIYRAYSSLYCTLYKQIFLQVSSIDILAQSLQINTQVQLTWYDERLSFLNLNDVRAFNSLVDMKDRLWTPIIEVR